MDLTKHFLSHPTEDVLEEYVFHHLPTLPMAQVEEHLLVCESCREALHKIDEFVWTMKASAGTFKPIQPCVPGAPRRTALWTGAGAMSLVAVTLVGLLVLHGTPKEQAAPAAITLSSIRGLEALSIVPAGKPLELHIDAPDLAPVRDYEIRLVDSAGGQIWKGTTTHRDGKPLAQIPVPLKAGVYWVRLYDATGTPLREFGMSAK